MSKRDKLKFTVKKSLVVGTATAAIGAAGCTGDVITNPVPTDSGYSDTADAGEQDSVIVNPMPPDAQTSEDGSTADDAKDGQTDGGQTDGGRADATAEDTG